jgi:hypothetical protein
LREGLPAYGGLMHPLGAPKRWCSDVGCPVPRSSDTGGSDTRILEARILEAWRLQGLQAKAWRLGVIAGWLVLVIGCVLTRSTLREVGGYPMIEIYVELIE